VSNPQHRRAASNGREPLTEQGAWSAFPFKRLVLAQCSVIALAAIVAMLDDLHAARSAAAGAMVCGAANAYAAWRVFIAGRRNGSQHGELANMYRAEFGKLVTIGVVSAVLFSVSSVDVLAYVGGCIGAILTGLLVAATFDPGVPGTHNTKMQDSHGE